MVFSDKKSQVAHQVPVSIHREEGNGMFLKYSRFYRDMLKYKESGNVWSILMKAIEVGQGRRIHMACRYVICAAVSDLKTGIDF